MLTKEEKTVSSDLVRLNENDTGSSPVQVSVLSAKIKKLTEHLKTNHKDQHSRRGLINMVEQRRKHLSYIKNKDVELYKKTVAAVGLRK